MPNVDALHVLCMYARKVYKETLYQCREFKNLPCRLLYLCNLVLDRILFAVNDNFTARK